MPYDLVLSSGFLAFAAQCGVLAAVEDTGGGVSGICGTSSGALAGSLWAAGLPAAEIFERLTESAPLSRLAFAWSTRGLFSMAPVIAELSADLPSRFEDLSRPFAVGVVDAHRRPVLLRSGPLAPAVAASCAIPYLFAPVDIGGQAFSDGGVRDRTGLSAWREGREHPVVLHLVDRSSGAQSADDLSDVTVIRSPCSGAKLWGLGDVRGRFDAARERARAVLTG